MPSNLGQKIKAARKSAGLTQREFAKKLGKSFSTVQKYENGIVEPPLSMVPDIAKVLKITPLELMETAIPWPGDVQPAIDARDRKSRLAQSFNILNADGQEKVATYAEDLTKVPRYRLQQHPQPHPAPPEGTDTTPTVPPPESTENGG